MHNMKWTTIVQMRHKIVYQDGTVQYTDIVYPDDGTLPLSNTRNRNISLLPTSNAE